MNPLAILIRSELRVCHSPILKRSVIRCQVSDVAFKPGRVLIDMLTRANEVSLALSTSPNFVISSLHLSTGEHMHILNYLNQTQDLAQTLYQRARSLRGPRFEHQTISVVF